MATKALLCVFVLLLSSSPCLSIRTLRDSGKPSIARGGRRLRMFGGHILRGMADAIQDPGEGHFLRGFADALSGQGSMSVSNGILTVTGSSGATFQETIQTDPVTGQSFVIDPSTGQQIFVDPITGQPLPSNSPSSGIQFDQFGQAFVIDPLTGAQVPVDPNTGAPLNQGPQIQFDQFGQAFQVDPLTGQQVFVDPNTGFPLGQQLQQPRMNGFNGQQNSLGFQGGLQG